MAKLDRDVARGLFVTSTTTVSGQSRLGAERHEPGFAEDLGPNNASVRDQQILLQADRKDPPRDNGKVADKLNLAVSSDAL